MSVADAYTLPVDVLLARYGLRLPDGWRDDPDALIDGDQFACLLHGVSEFIKQGGTSAQSMLLEAFPLTIHGYVGLAAMTASNLQQAMEIGTRYFHHVMPAFDTNFVIDGDTCVINVDPVSDFGDYNGLLAETTLCAVNSILPFSDLGYDDLTVTLQHDRLTMTGFASFYPGVTVAMGSAHNTLAFPAAALATPLRTGNAATFGMIEAELARRETLLTNRQTLIYRVFMIIKEDLTAGVKANAQSTAAALHLSLRTFNRRLSEEGTSFKVIREQCRFDLAAQLLTHSNKPMVVISTELGFANESSFSRYIKDQTGLSPMQFRKRSRP